MKKIALGFLLLLSNFLISNAQQRVIGIRGGINFASQNISNIVVPAGASLSIGYRTDFLAGFYLTKMINSRLGVQPELFYSSIGNTEIASISYQSTFVTASGETSMDYISLPVFLRINIDHGIHFLFGPQLSYLASAKTTIRASGLPATPVDVKDSYQIFDFGLVGGIGIDTGKFNVGIRYMLGLANVNKNPRNPETEKNYAIQIVAGYRLTK